MDLDCKWFESEAARDVFETMRSQESTLPRFAEVADLEGRNEVVNWILKFSKGIYIGTDKYVLHARTIHLAVYLFDCYVHLYPENDLMYVAAGAALLVATKFEESSHSFIVWRAVVALLRTVWPHEVRQMEQSILKAINWRLLVPTAVSYIPYLVAATDLNYSVLMANARKNAPETPSQYWYLPEIFSFCTRPEAHFRNCEFFESLVYILCSFSLTGPGYKQFKLSQIASSAVAAARFCIGAAPTWPSSIRGLTQYTLEELCNCIYLLLHDLDAEMRHDSELLPKLPRAKYAACWLTSARTIVSSASPTVQVKADTTATPDSPSSPDAALVTNQNPQLLTTFLPVLLMLELPTGERFPMIWALQPNAASGAERDSTPPVARQTSQAKKMRVK